LNLVFIRNNECISLAIVWSGFITKCDVLKKLETALAPPFKEALHILIPVSIKSLKWYWYWQFFKNFLSGTLWVFKGIVSKLTIKFWMCQKYGKRKDYNNKKWLSAVEWLQTHWINKSSHLLLRLVDWHVLNSVHKTR
jgi:hypothetical protein